ncbi:MAG TPA: hypothetical protein VK427_11775, partial [Kofleriaceae bacterium]|nr:hypothetical protein [Kofleriaceae bacterium]
MSFVALTSPLLSFTRDGRRLVAIDDALAIVEIASGATKRVDVRRAIAAVGFVDQIWVAHGDDLCLARFGMDGQRLGAHPLVGDCTLVAAPIGAPAVMWGATALLVDDGGTMRTSAAPAADLVLPLTARRWVMVKGARVVAPSGLCCELAPGSRVLGGA